MGASRPHPQRGPRLDQRAVVRSRNADRSPCSTGRPPCPTFIPTSAPTTSTSSWRQRNRYGRYRVSLRGRGRAYDDPARSAARAPGRPVDVAMDLVWTTVGTPYQYRITTRYEIPVHGVGHRHGRRPVVRVHRRRRPARPLVGGAGLVGHGMGVERTAPRRRHARARRRHAHPRRAPHRRSDTVQRAGEPLVELQTRHGATRSSATTTYRAGPRLELSPGDVTATIDVRGHAPVLLTSPDGRMSRFPAGLGDGDHHRRPHRCRLAGVESQPVVTAQVDRAVRLAALFEIGGAWMVWQGVREHRGWLWAGAGVLAFGRLRIRRGISAGRALRTCAGGVRRACSSLVRSVWGMVADGFRPDRWDVVGALVCLLGVGLIMYAPR